MGRIRQSKLAHLRPHQLLLSLLILRVKHHLLNDLPVFFNEMLLRDSSSAVQMG